MEFQYLFLLSMCVCRILLRAVQNIDPNRYFHVTGGHSEPVRVLHGEHRGPAAVHHQFY